MKLPPWWVSTLGYDRVSGFRVWVPWWVSTLGYQGALGWPFKAFETYSQVGSS